MQQHVEILPAHRASGAEVQLLCVGVADYRCGLPVEAVVEVHAAVQLAPLPDAPDVVIGLVNRRGQPLAVLDLRRRLGLPSRPLQVDDRLVVLQLADREVALLVDEAVDVLVVPASAVDEAVAADSEAVHSLGVVALPDGLLVVLDLAAFLSSTEAFVLDQALQQSLATSSA